MYGITLKINLNKCISDIIENERWPQDAVILFQFYKMRFEISWIELPFNNSTVLLLPTINKVFKRKVFIVQRIIS